MPDGPGRFGQGFPCPALLRVPPRVQPHARTGLSPPPAGLSRPFRFAVVPLPGGPTTPHRPEPVRFGLIPFRSPLLGESLLFSPPPGTEMFQFPGFASRLPAGWHASRVPGCPIRIPADRRLHAPPRSFSQLVTSFLASGSPGIPRAPLLTSPAQRRPSPTLHRKPPGIPAGGPSCSFTLLPHLHHVKELLTAKAFGSDTEYPGPSRWSRPA